MNKPLSPAKIRSLILEEINSNESLRASSRAVYEVGCLVDTSVALDKESITHLLALLHQNIEQHVDKIEALARQLGE